MEIDFTIVSHGSTAWEEAVKLREDILRKPLGSTFTREELDEEKHHYQIVGRVNGALIATAVLVPEQNRLKMQRVVVSPTLRNRNFGSRMMNWCETFALEKGYQTLYCHARDSAVNFYLNNGYQGEGEYFDEDGIPHLKMTKKVK